MTFCPRVFFFIISGFFTLLLHSKQLIPRGSEADINASSAILINGETGRILYKKACDTPCYPASTTKVATALYALKKKGECLDQMVAVSQEAVGYVSETERRSKHPSYRLEFGGTQMGIKVGEELPLRDLLYGLMLPSGNDAANVIAEYVSGSIPRFMEELNNYLISLGCKQTHLCNPHGLSDPKHVTTAYEMALIAQEAMKIPFFREVVRTPSYSRPKTNKQEGTVLSQHNRLLRRGAFFYPKAIGVKTGYTLSSGGTLVAAAEEDGRMLISVVMGCTNLNQAFKDTITLFEAAFAESKASRVLFTKQQGEFSLSFKRADSVLEASLAEDLKLEYYPSEKPEFKAYVHWDNLTLPIAQGQKVGEVHIVAKGGDLLTKGFLYAEKEVKKTRYYRFLDGVKKCIPDLSFPIIVLLFILGLFSLVLFIKEFKKAPQLP